MLSHHLLHVFFQPYLLFIFQTGCWGTNHQALVLWPKAIPSLCICVCGILFSFETGSYSLAQASLELTIARLASSLQWSPCLHPSFAGFTIVRQYTWTRACCARQSYVVLSWISLIRMWWNGFTEAREPKKAEAPSEPVLSQLLTSLEDEEIERQLWSSLCHWMKKPCCFPLCFWSRHRLMQKERSQHNRGCRKQRFLYLPANSNLEKAILELQLKFGHLLAGTCLTTCPSLKSEDVM